MHLRTFLAGLCLAIVSPLAAQITINVNANANRHPIDPRIYGAASATQAAITDLGITLNRWGGNRATRYNWMSNYGNTANDWCFYNTDDDSADTFVSKSKAAGAQPVITIPMIGYTAKDDTSFSWDMVTYAGQDGPCDQWHPRAGSGRDVRVTGNKVAGTSNGSLTASMLADSTFEANWVQHLVDTFGPASGAGVRYYSLDNEPSLWHESHFDIYPHPLTYANAWTRMQDYASKIRAKDAAALITGPEEWEWTALFDDAYDWANNVSTDRTAAGNLDYLPWLLAQFKNYADAHGGTRLLDVATVHYYPQGGEFSADDTLATQALRNRSTRSLWDPSYVDESWMGATTYPGQATKLNNGIPMLVPQLKQWVSTYYPGTLVGVTEYNWGDDDHINGGTAQADVLGILGREGADIGVRWTAPNTGTFTYNAFKMYRNYDGQHSAFGDVSVSASVPNPDQVAAFAAIRSSDRALTLMLINKVASPQNVAINLSGFPGRTAIQRWRLDSGNAIVSDTQLPLQGSSVNFTLPAQTIMLLVVLPAAGDFNGDSKMDVVLRNYSTGQNALWLLNGTSLASVVDLPALPNTNWRIEGTADFNRDGQTDIVLRNYATGQNAVWLMNGTSLSSIVDLPALPNVNYHIEGTADLNLDGNPDIIIRNYATGQDAAWLMNGTSLSAIVDLPALPNTAYKIESAGDFNADGNPDIVLRNYSTGQNALWLMNGTTLASVVDLPPLPNTAYRIDAIGDFDGDGKPDIVLRNYTTGQNAVWVMNGTSLAAIVDLPALLNTSYEINGPR